MLIILDTNVLISSFLRAGSIPDQILSLVLTDKIVVAATREIFGEYWAVLRRKKFQNLDQIMVAEVMAGLERKVVFVEPNEVIDFISHDPSDNKFLACAVESKAEFLITGNTNDFTFEYFRETRIVSPRGFIEAII